MVLIFNDIITISTAANVAANANSRANSGGEAMGFAFLGDSVVDFAKSCANLNPSGLVYYTDIDGSKVKQVKNKEGNLRPIRDSFEIMAATSDLHLEAMSFAANNGSLDVGLVQCSENEHWFGGERFVEPEVSNVSLKNRRIGRVVGSVDGRRGRKRRVGMAVEALNECLKVRIKSCP